jgi:AcrR family transcriptional regulator
MSVPRALPRGRHSLSREAVAESQRGRMIDAIVELVAADGYAGTTVGAIAATAGVSRTTFYEQFGTKEACFRAAYDAVASELIAAIVAASSAARDPDERVGAGIDAYLEWFAARPAAAVTYVVEVHTAGPDALAQRADVLGRFREVIAAAAPDAPRAAQMALVASVDAMAHDLVRRGRAADLPSLSADARDVAGRLLG